MIEPLVGLFVPLRSPSTSSRLTPSSTRFFHVYHRTPGIGGILFRPGEWYRQLNKPSWRPSDWLFAPVWALLYGTIAVAGWLVWREAGFSGAVVPLSVYGIQLLLNAAWSPIFFGLHRIGLALAEMVLLWLSIVATIILFHPIHAAASALLTPYLCWVSFALMLNLSI